MKVLHVITGLAAGGAESQLRLLLQHARHDADVVALYNAGSVADQLRADGVPVTDLGMRSNTEVGAVLRLARLVRRGRYDVVHTHLYRAGLYGRLAARLAGVPVVVATEHSLLDDQLEGRPATRPVRLLYLAAERLGRRTVAVSSAVRANLLGWGIAADRVVTVPNGLDLDAVAFDAGRRERARSALGLADGAQLVGAVGRLHAGKRFDELITALAPSLGRDRQLVVVGEGASRPELAALAERLGVATAVHLVGEQPVAEVLPAMDVLVSPSHYETFGLAVLEGLAAGLPVVYRRCPGLEELDAEVAGAARIGVGDALLPAVEDALARGAGDRTCPPALRALDIRSVAARIDDLYDELHDDPAGRGGRPGRRRTRTGPRVGQRSQPARREDR
ncbi:glycosyltransferase [Blastococcus haudaquaticus]|uniref:Glycosyltransferase involved in cell wall bisynthesis n=1 Tax=Blastococcus haudaquaticus TaxID=1938745 RepID=A0A286GY47_9ACTN|nr:glycosyltransferase [Blastococcus haudaquaticus]SOE00433.1 Glycosyltransferase involved in cell wall bisynthesis [Blastococcus haudaquaticus]